VRGTGAVKRLLCVWVYKYSSIIEDGKQIESIQISNSQFLADDDAW